MSALIDTTITRQYDTVVRRDPPAGGAGAGGRSTPLPPGYGQNDGDEHDGKVPGWRRHWEGVDPRNMPPGIAKKFGFPKHDNGKHKGGKGKHGRDDD